MRFLAPILVLQLTTSSICLAQVAPPEKPKFQVEPSTALVPIPPGPDVIVPMKKGDPAPSDGQFFDNNTALRWGHYLEQAKTRLKLDVDLQKQIMKINGDYYENVLKYERDKYTNVTNDLQNKLTKAEAERDNPPWYKSQWFAFTIGVVATGAAIGLTAYAISSIK